MMRLLCVITSLYCMMCAGVYIITPAGVQVLADCGTGAVGRFCWCQRLRQVAASCISGDCRKLTIAADYFASSHG